MSLYTQASQPPSWDRWVNNWTVFYWLWPLAWSPFAGLFIARISRGRSVREVAFAGIGATSMATVRGSSSSVGLRSSCKTRALHTSSVL